MIDNKPVTLFISGQKNGCNFYRIDQPCAKIFEKEYLPCANSSDLTQGDFALWLEKADLIVTQCYVAEKFVEYMIEMKGEKKFVVDMDDNIFEVSPFNPSYERNGLEEVDITLPDGKKFEIRNGSSGFYSQKPIDFKDNRRRVMMAGQCLKMADIVTTPSGPLASVFKRLNPNVDIIKNSINFNFWNPLPLKKDDTIRIGWQGGWSHFMDFFEVKWALENIMYQHKNVVLVIMGQSFPGIFENIPKDRIEFHGFVNIETYPFFFKTLNLDIGIAPLEDNEFNRCKSEIKWEEYSALNIPTAASAVPPYSFAIDHGTTGFLCKNRDEWYQTLSELILNKELRERIGANARNKVKEKYDLDKVIHENIESYSGLFRPKLITV